MTPVTLIAMLVVLTTTLALDLLERIILLHLHATSQALQNDCHQIAY